MITDVMAWLFAAWCIFWGAIMGVFWLWMLTGFLTHQHNRRKVARNGHSQ